MKKMTRMLCMALALMLALCAVGFAEESLNLAELPLTTEEGATVSILAQTSDSSATDETDDTTTSDYDYTTTSTEDTEETETVVGNAALNTVIQETDAEGIAVQGTSNFATFEITLTLENGYLTVAAAKGLDVDKENKKGKVIRQERYAGAMQRSFYVGEALTEQDISAKFENGVLSLGIPKKDEKKLPERKTIQIEG